MMNTSIPIAGSFIGSKNCMNANICGETPPSVTGTQYYVTLLRCDRKDAERVLSEAGLPIGQFAFEDVPLEDVGKSSKGTSSNAN